MSPNVGNFVHDLVEMAKAMETLPQVEAELSQAKAETEILRQTVAAREEAILRYKAEIETLHETIRKVEVERDSAETMFLELDEKVHTVLGNAASIGVLVEGVKGLLDPPKPIPVPEPTPEPVYTASGFEQSQDVGYSHDPLPVEVPKSDANPTDQTASMIDPEPPRFTPDGWTSQEWYEWRDRQPTPGY